MQCDESDGELKSGTKIFCHRKEDLTEFTEEHHLKDLVKQHNEFIGFPSDPCFQKSKDNEVTDSEEESSSGSGSSCSSSNGSTKLEVRPVGLEGAEQEHVQSSLKASAGPRRPLWADEADAAEVLSAKHTNEAAENAAKEHSRNVLEAALKALSTMTPINGQLLSIRDESAAVVRGELARLAL